jgi:hypothetical protein
MLRFLKTLFAIYGACIAVMYAAGMLGIGEFRMFYGTSATLAERVSQTCAAWHADK